MTKGSWWSNKHRKYKYQDKKAGLEYNLTLDQAKALMSLPCFYCCRPESKGLDRISNDFGHTTSNVVPCCGTCNLMLASTPWAAKIEMRESLRSIREKGLLGSWKPPYLTEPAKAVRPPLENQDAESELVYQMAQGICDAIDDEIMLELKSASIKKSPRNGLCFWPHPDEMTPEDCPPTKPTDFNKPVVLTEEEVRKLLEEGRECRKDLEKRIQKMHEFTPEMMNDKAKSASTTNSKDKLELEDFPVYPIDPEGIQTC